MGRFGYRIAKIGHIIWRTGAPVGSVEPVVVGSVTVGSGPPETFYMVNIFSSHLN